MARRRLRLIFPSAAAREPVIHELGRRVELVTDIRRAEVTRELGWMLLEVSG